MIKIVDMNTFMSKLIPSDSDESIEEFHKVKNYFSILDQSLIHTYKYKNGIIDGKKKFVREDGSFLYGLKNKIIEYMKNNNIEYVDETSSIFTEITDLGKHIKKLNLPFEPYQYQIEGALKSLQEKRKVCLAATGSGKSLIIYIITTYLLSKGYKGLLVVPTTSLVDQMYSDFKEYSTIKLEKYKKMLENDPNNLSLRKKTKKIYEDIFEIHNNKKFDDIYSKIYAGEDKFTDHQMKICTWQSIYDIEDADFYDVDFMIGDECLHPDTLILTKNGMKPIKVLDVDDIVLTYNESKMLYEYKPVIKVHKNISKEQMFELVTYDNKVLRITGNHKVLLTNGDWKRVDQLLVGDDIISF